MIIANMFAHANPRMYTPDTPVTVSHLDSNLCDTGETPETVETPGSTFFRMKDDANM
jgi:hypothetical protein